MKHEWPIVVESPVVQALREGRAKIERGWCQGHFIVERPEWFGGDLVCPIKALGQTYDAVGWLQKALPRPYLSVIVYNDHPTTTQADILALYDRAIEIALAQ